MSPLSGTQDTPEFSHFRSSVSATELVLCENALKSGAVRLLFKPLLDPAKPSPGASAAPNVRARRTFRVARSPSRPEQLGGRTRPFRRGRSNAAPWCCGRAGRDRSKDRAADPAKRSRSSEAPTRGVRRRLMDRIDDEHRHRHFLYCVDSARSRSAIVALPQANCRLAKSANRPLAAMRSS